MTILQGFIPVAERHRDGETVDLCRTWAERLRTAAEAAWDGEWYLRGWYDDGAPLGSHTSEECRIDAIAQSWAALTPGTDRSRAEQAVRAALDRLFLREPGVVRLFAPAFDRGEQDPGYIRGYVPGVRENGGQYTHAAAWLALACYELGMAEESWEVLSALLPENHPPEVYQAEPFVLAADVYSNPAHLGRGGWSWYTGAAGWYLQTVMKGLFGITVKDKHLTISPNIPASWSGCSIRWTLEQGSLNITVKRGGCRELRLDGKMVDFIQLGGLTGEHTAEVTVPPAAEM